MRFFYLYIDEFVGKGLEVSVILQMVLYFIPSLIPDMLPLAILLTSIMTLGKIGESFELAAMKSAGLSLYRIIRPLMIFILLVSCGAFLFYNYTIPYSSYKSKNLYWNISRVKPALNIKPNVFNNLVEGFNIRVSKKYGENGNMLKDVIIYDYSNGIKYKRIITASRGEMKIDDDTNTLIFSLEDGYIYENVKVDSEQGRKNRPFTKAKFEENILYVDLSPLKNTDLNSEISSKEYSMLNISQIYDRMDTVKLESRKQIQDVSTRNYNQIHSIRSNSSEIDNIDIASIDETSFLNVWPKNSTFKSLDSLQSRIANSDQTYLIQTGIDNIRRKYEDIKRELEMAKYRKTTLAKYEIEIHKKYALSFNCLVLFFIGAPLGAIIRRGGMGAPVVIGIVIFLLNYVMSRSGQHMGEELKLSPFLAVWYPSMFLLPFGIWLTRKATNDSKLFNIEVYINPFRKLIRYTKNKKNNA
ncbi:permease [Ichthyobacterium seriolicida]|uniref:Permease n=2 Tax=Ichthyobacterium seriolicida TaxID=242600 RepID=A0A1J1E168_9FLAO|nr:permease [Ichthyobacterium seriolicida]